MILRPSEQDTGPSAYKYMHLKNTACTVDLWYSGSSIVYVGYPMEDWLSEARQKCPLRIELNIGLSALRELQVHTALEHICRTLSFFAAIIARVRLRRSKLPKDAQARRHGQSEDEASRWACAHPESKHM